MALKTTNTQGRAADAEAQTSTAAEKPEQGPAPTEAAVAGAEAAVTASAADGSAQGPEAAVVPAKTEETDGGSPAPGADEAAGAAANGRLKPVLSIAERLGEVMAGAAILQGSLGAGLPFWGFALATYGWGLGGAIFINGSRTIFQEHAPAAYRGRVLAAYQLGFTGGGPIGAFASGFVISGVGLGETFFVSASMMGLLVAGMSLFSNVPRIE